MGPNALEFNSFGDVIETLTAHEQGLRGHSQAITTAYRNLSGQHEQLKNLVSALRELNNVLQHCDAASYRAHTELADRVTLLEERIRPSRPTIWVTLRRIFSTCTLVLCRYLRGTASSSNDDPVAEPTSQGQAAEPADLIPAQCSEI